MPVDGINGSNRTANAYDVYATSDLASPIICGGSKGSGKSSIESMGGSDGAKSWAQRFFDYASQLCCVGPVFKVMAGWFNIQVEGAGNGNRRVDERAQLEAMKTISDIFTKNEKLDEKQIGKAKEAFKKLSPFKKLFLIEHVLLEGRCKCKSKDVFLLIQMLGRDVLADLKKFIGKESDVNPDGALKKCKSDENVGIVKAAFAECLDNLPKKGVKLIADTFKKESPSSKELKLALDVFRGLESPLAQLQVLLDLFKSPHITERQRAEFYAALPGKKAPAEDDGAIESTKGKKGTKKKREVASDSDAEETTVLFDIQGELLKLIKAVRGGDEEAAVRVYDAYKKLKSRAKQDRDGNFVIQAGDGSEVLLHEVPKPVVCKTLKEYVIAGASDNAVRILLQEQTEVLLGSLERARAVEI